MAARLEQRQLAAAVDLEVGVRIAHAVDVADLAGEVEDHLAALHQVVHRAGLAHVGDVHRDAVLDAGDVEQVAAVVGNQRIDQQDVGAELHQAVREVAADEAEPAGDHHAAAAIEIAGGHRRSLAAARLRRAAGLEVLAANHQRHHSFMHVDQRAERRAGS